jgi:hypothetical protein
VRWGNTGEAQGRATCLWMAADRTSPLPSIPAGFSHPSRYELRDNHPRHPDCFWSNASRSRSPCAGERERDLRTGKPREWNRCTPREGHPRPRPALRWTAEGRHLIESGADAARTPGLDPRTPRPTSRCLGCGSSPLGARERADLYPRGCAEGSCPRCSGGSSARAAPCSRGSVPRPLVYTPRGARSDPAGHR